MVRTPLHDLGCMLSLQIPGRCAKDGSGGHFLQDGSMDERKEKSHEIRVSAQTACSRGQVHEEQHDNDGKALSRRSTNLSGHKGDREDNVTADKHLLCDCGECPRHCLHGCTFFGEAKLECHRVLSVK